MPLLLIQFMLLLFPMWLTLQLPCPLPAQADTNGQRGEKLFLQHMLVQVVCVDMRRLAAEADRQLNKGGELSEQCINDLRSAYSSFRRSHRTAALVVTNQMLKLFFSLKQQHNAKAPMDAIEMGHLGRLCCSVGIARECSCVRRRFLGDAFPAPQRVTFFFYCGMYAFRVNDYRAAQQHLTEAEALCRPAAQAGQCGSQYVDKIY